MAFRSPHTNGIFVVSSAYLVRSDGDVGSVNYYSNIDGSYGTLRGSVKMILFAILNHLDIIIAAIVVLIILLPTALPEAWIILILYGILALLVIFILMAVIQVVPTGIKLSGYVY